MVNVEHGIVLKTKKKERQNKKTEREGSSPECFCSTKLEYLHWLAEPTGVYG